jgi:uncharacterized protein YggT (Ycf19 family)
MLTFAADFWPMFWTVIGIGAVLSSVLAYAVASNWPQRRHQDATLVELAAAYRAAAAVPAQSGEHATAA